MKKLLTATLAATMLLTACSGQTLGGIGFSGGTSRPGNSSSRHEPAAPDFKSAIEETVLVDEKDIKITANTLTYTEYSADLAVTIENNSGDELSFRSGTMGYACNSINGYMVDGGYLNTDVAAGKKSRETISFDFDELAILGITDIADIEIGFDIEDSDYDTYLQTGPISLKTPLADTYDYSADTYKAAINSGVLAGESGYTVDYFAEEPLYDQSGIKVISQAVITNADNEKALLLEVENTSSDHIYAATGNFQFNGLLVQRGSWTSDSINSGKRRVMVLNLSYMPDDTYWDAFGITDIADITFSFTPKSLDYEDLQTPEDLKITIPGVTASYDDSGEVLYSENNVQIIFKKVVSDSSSYSDDVHVLLLAKNNTGKPINVDIDYESLSVNGFMTDFYCFGPTISAGGSGIVDIQLDGSSLEENGVSGVNDVEDIDMTIIIQDSNYNSLSEPVVTIKMPKA